MSDWRVWLTCTRSGCKHKRTHRTPEEATRAARIFMADFVTHNGHTVCAHCSTPSASASDSGWQALRRSPRCPFSQRAPMNAETGGGLTEVLAVIETALAEILKDPDGRDPAWEALWIGDEIKPLLAARVAAARADGRESLAGEVRALIDLADKANTGVAFGGGRFPTMVPADALRALVAPTGNEGQPGDAG